MKNQNSINGRGPLVDGKFLFEHVLTKRQLTDTDRFFDSITMPPWTQYVSMHDIEILYWAATSKSMAGNVDNRRKIIRQVLEPRGFKRLTGGTNRDVFVHYEDQSIVAKVALDMVGLGDNQKEYDVQRELFPWVTKMIQVCPSGVLGFAERVTPILSRKEYNAYLPMIYVMLNEVLGKYIMEDIGTEFFKNIGIRKDFGAVLLDYPYAYELDANKLQCSNVLLDGTICGGEIDYDSGMNYLLCKRCGKRYYASELQKQVDKSQISTSTIKGGKRPMIARLVKNGKVIAGTLDSDSIIRPDVATPQQKESRPSRVTSVNIIKNGKIIAGTDAPSCDNTVSTILTLPGIEEDEPVSTEKDNTQKVEEKEVTLHYEAKREEDPDDAVMMSFSQVEDMDEDPMDVITKVIAEHPDLEPAIKSFAKQVAESYLMQQEKEVKVEYEIIRPPIPVDSTVTENVATINPIEEDTSNPPELLQNTNVVTQNSSQETKPKDNDEFPPVQWMNNNGGKIVEPEEERITPYYIHPKEQDDDDKIVIVASRRKKYYRKNNNGFLGGGDK